MTDQFYIVDIILPWDSLASGGHTIGEDEQYGSIGAMFAFDDLDKAIAFRDAISPDASINWKERVSTEVRRDD